MDVAPALVAHEAVEARDVAQPGVTAFHYRNCVDPISCYVRGCIERQGGEDLSARLRQRFGNRRATLQIEGDGIVALCSLPTNDAVS